MSFAGAVVTTASTNAPCNICTTSIPSHAQPPSWLRYLSSSYYAAWSLARPAFIAVTLRHRTCSRRFIPMYIVSLDLRFLPECIFTSRQPEYTTASPLNCVCTNARYRRTSAVHVREETLPRLAFRPIYPGEGASPTASKVLHPPSLFGNACMCRKRSRIMRHTLDRLPIGP